MHTESTKFVCHHCNRTFSRENTLINHMCEQKRRFDQKNDMGVQIGLHAYAEFYRQQGNAVKTYDEFRKSKFYNAFVKFGNYCRNSDVINIKEFIDFLLKNNKKLDHWCDDAIYDQYLHFYLRKESMHDAIDRSIKTMKAWAEKNNSAFNRYFDDIGRGSLSLDLASGKISSWVIYNCKSGMDALGEMNSEQVDIAFSQIDPEFWINKFERRNSDTEWVKRTLKESGIS